MTEQFALDRQTGKLMGVCAGFARWADVDVTLVRITAALVILFAWPVAALAYILVGIIAETR